MNDKAKAEVSIEKRALKVLKGFAGLKDITLGHLLEGIPLQVFEGSREEISR